MYSSIREDRAFRPLAKSDAKSGRSQLEFGREERNIQCRPTHNVIDILEFVF